eukprot:CAMPEP_0169229900 /NCGR_PEP_ID=MMETSP1016-20121227/25632_1 /TAXON_ID=342587 /ORGANISM="Karlodinium micrum, Strain CCMP2283" /LENGTH=261 /DNA_ID=CAMNT_0009308813 /DNA_START=70 /DNA_END=853 /DNA_ORIENTATION=-
MCIAVHPSISFALVSFVSLASCQKLRGSDGKKVAESSGCKGSACNGLSEDRFAVLVEKGSATVYIGDSTVREKCVTNAVPVSCAEDAGNRGKRLNDQKLAYDDKFSITVKGGTTVCARRLDEDAGWNQPLKIACKDIQQKTDKCMCLTSADGDCACKGCSDDEQMQTCSELLVLASAAGPKKEFAIAMVIAILATTGSKLVKMRLAAHGVACGAKRKWACCGVDDANRSSAIDIYIECLCRLRSFLCFTDSHSSILDLMSL